MDLFIEMGPPMSESQVKESQSRAVPPIFTQGQGGRGMIVLVVLELNFKRF